MCDGVGISCHVLCLALLQGKRNEYQFHLEKQLQKGEVVTFREPVFCSLMTVLLLR